MNRIPLVDPALATGKVKQLFDGAQAKLGAVPNLFRVIGNSPTTLEAYLTFSGLLAKGSLGSKVNEQIALAIAEANLCEYCLSAHSYIGGKLGLTEKDLSDARHATAASGKTDAILKLARGIVVARGDISDGDLQEARAAGLNDGEIIEVLGNVALNIFTNYVNHVARTAVDFPVVPVGNTEPVVSKGSTTDCGCTH